MDDREQYFDILGLKPGAPPEEIVNAYTALREYWNPERVPEFYKQKAMEGRDRIEEAYRELMGLRRKEQKEVCRLTPKSPEQQRAEQPTVMAERILLGKGQDGTVFYLDRKSVVTNKDRVEVSVDIYPPESSDRLNTARGHVRRAGYDHLECLTEKWGISLSSGVFVRYGQFYKSTCGHLVEGPTDIRKVWKPIMPGTIEEAAWKAVDETLNKEKVA